MKIDIREIPTFLLSPAVDTPKFSSRRSAVTGALQVAGFKSVTVVDGFWGPADAVLACAYTHLLAIEQALTQTNPFRPFLILEDDSLLDPERPVVLDIPDDADACWLGTTTTGAAFNAAQYVHHDHGTFYSDTSSPPWVRIYNM
ncbi:MAG TPA: hypothetical protein VFH51_19415, partial [Myxococcota bacterium]|nr:hypothetical protein [Myxococcota bacterium]